MKDPVLLRTEDEVLEVESQRRRGSDSSTKKTFVFSAENGSTDMLGTAGFGVRPFLQLRARASFSTSS